MSGMYIIHVTLTIRVLIEAKIISKGNMTYLYFQYSITLILYMILTAIIKPILLETQSSIHTRSHKNTYYNHDRINSFSMSYGKSCYFSKSMKLSN